MRSLVFADLRKHRVDARNIVGLIVTCASSKEADVDWLLLTRHKRSIIPLSGNQTDASAKISTEGLDPGLRRCGISPKSGLP